MHGSNPCRHSGSRGPSWYNPRTDFRRHARQGKYAGPTNAISPPNNQGSREIPPGPRRPLTSSPFLQFPPFLPEYFGREDESDDSNFYVQPRLVVHIDDGAIAAVGNVFRSMIPPDAAVLDLMSSWRSHWPPDHPRARLAGLGMNAVEMQENPDLDDYLIQDINKDPVLPYEDDTFDAVVITVSVQYLTSPIEVFQQVNRILKPGGVFIVTFSNRMFPTKAVKIWRYTTDRRHIDLVAAYLEEAGDYEEIRGGFVNPDASPPCDPLFAVVANKASGKAPNKASG